MISYSAAVLRPPKNTSHSFLRFTSKWRHVRHARTIETGIYLVCGGANKQT